MHAGPMAKGKASRWTAADAECVFAAWRRSGKSLTAYARERGVSVQRFYYWRKRGLAFETAAAGAPPTFAAAIVRPSSTVATLRIGAEIALELEVPAAVPAEWVAALVRAVTRR